MTMQRVESHTGLCRSAVTATDVLVQERQEIRAELAGWMTMAAAPMPADATLTETVRVALVLAFLAGANLVS